MSIVRQVGTDNVISTFYTCKTNKAAIELIAWQLPMENSIDKSIIVLILTK